MCAGIEKRLLDFEGAGSRHSRGQYGSNEQIRIIS
jgi:hypothetical protein